MRSVSTRVGRRHLGPIGLGAAFLLLVGLAVILESRLNAGPLILCMFRAWTGLPCPSCGTTRMVLAMLQGRPVEAFLWNPLMWLLIASAFAVLLVRVLTGRRYVWITSPARRHLTVVLLILAVLANWIYLLRTH